MSQLTPKQDQGCNYDGNTHENRERNNELFPTTVPNVAKYVHEIANCVAIRWPIKPIVNITSATSTSALSTFLWYQRRVHGESDRCKKRSGSCLTNQPEDFWQEDQAKAKNNKTQSYMLGRWGDLHITEESPDENTDRKQKTVLLSYGVKQLHASVLRIELNAKYLNFTTNVGSGEIVDASVETFEAQKDIGQMVV
eukprot:Platyproteum_vivax@DN748_c0_g1_i1.p1